MKSESSPVLLAALALGILLLPACVPARSLMETEMPQVPAKTAIATSLAAVPTAQNTHPPLLTQTPFSSPGMLLFTSGLYEESEIYALNLEEAKSVRLTFDQEPDCCADWAPDGNQIVYASLRQGNWDIYLLDLTSGQEIRLTRDAGIDQYPAWSPDGDRIAFHSNRGGTTDIYVMNVDGSGQTRLTNNGSENTAPDWSPDGRKLVYESVNYSNNPAAREELFVMNADGSEPVQLTKNNVQDLSPAWSPDGWKIAYMSTPSHNADEYNLGIYIVQVEGGEVMQLTFDTKAEGAPAWSPDGSRIAYLSSNPTEAFSDSYIYEMNADGSHQRQIAHFLSTVSNLAWSSRTEPIRNSDCTEGWTQLKIGNYAAVAGQNDTPNRVRSGPSRLEEVIAQVYPGTPLKVIEGPVCADGLIFWKVEHKSIPGGSGWTAEGDGKEYWLEPYTP